MTTKKWFFEKNSEFLSGPYNCCFEDILWLNKEEFKNWCIELRKEVVRVWDAGQPPIVGQDEQGMIEQLELMEPAPVHQFVLEDELTGTKDVIRNTLGYGSVANQFFPNMLKTRTNLDERDVGLSIYNWMADDTLIDRFVTYASRNFKRDSFYSYSTPVQANNTEQYGQLPVTDDPVEWVKEFERTYRDHGQLDYWLSPKRTEEYKGYNPEIREKVFMELIRADIEALGSIIPDRCKTNIDWNMSERYQIRVFPYGQKLFPIGFRAFYLSFGTKAATNFPPLTAKYLYETYTSHIAQEEPITVYDPSCGWGGRILGAMAVKDDIKLHYVGTDPNPDNSTENGRTKYHELADFYHKNIRKGGIFAIDHNTYEIFQDGSEVIANNPAFQKYKGKLDMVFTSPPYFNREAYAEDDNQSFKKFSTYESWRDGFLGPTLRTAYEYLKPQRYLLWNIGDLKIGDTFLPLEEDSRKFLLSFGMEYKGYLKMVMAQMPGGHRVQYNEDGTSKATTKNFCQVGGKLFKYEPILIFWKN